MVTGMRVYLLTYQLRESKIATFVKAYCIVFGGYVTPLIQNLIKVPGEI